MRYNERILSLMNERVEKDRFALKSMCGVKGEYVVGTCYWRICVVYLVPARAFLVPVVKHTSGIGRRVYGPL